VFDVVDSNTDAQKVVDALKQKSPEDTELL
jgi:hypothetical protein